MHKTDRQHTAQKRMFGYARHKALVLEFETRATSQTGKSDTPHVRGSYHADPVARGGVMLADPPRKMKLRVAWCAAIEDAWAECLAEDAANGCSGKGIAHVMEEYFCLTGKEREKEKNGEMRAKLCGECGISVRTFYDWLGVITDIVVYHAAKRNLL